jgi:hypothetical protein
MTTANAPALSFASWEVGSDRLGNRAPDLLHDSDAAGRCDRMSRDSIRVRVLLWFGHEVAPMTDPLRKVTEFVGEHVQGVFFTYPRRGTIEYLGVRDVAPAEALGMGRWRITVEFWPEGEEGR